MDDVNTNRQLRIYDDSQKYIRLSNDETIARGLNKWKDWQCSAGVRGLYIDFDGNVWRCNTASSGLYRFNLIEWHAIVDRIRPPRELRNAEWWPIEEAHLVDYKKTKTAFKKLLQNTEENKIKNPGFLGNIFDGFDLPRSWFKCPWESCGCGADVILSKAKSSMYKILLNVTHSDWEGKERTLNDMVESIKEPIAVELNYPIPYQILWDLGRRCNYDCSYCWPTIHNRTDDHLDFDVLVRTADTVIEQWADNKTIRWNFGGGEPTLHPKFVDFLKYLKSKNQWTMVTSNGTRDHKYWSVAAQNLNSVILSAHFEGLRDDKDEERFVRNIETICEYFDKHDDDHWLEVKLMTPPKYIDRALNLRAKIRSLNMLNKPGANNKIKGVLSLVPIRSIDDSGKLVNYTEEQLSIFMNQQT